VSTILFFSQVNLAVAMVELMKVWLFISSIISSSLLFRNSFLNLATPLFAILPKKKPESSLTLLSGKSVLKEKYTAFAIEMKNRTKERYKIK